MSLDNEDRYSRVIEPYVIENEDDRAYAEAKNALQQFDKTVALAEKWIGDSSFSLKPSQILQLNRFALDGIHPSAGTYRTGNMEIVGSTHDPVNGEDVATEIEALCDYIKDNWDNKSAIHLSAYALWKLNWIHPFADGNGRTARALSYLILCAKLGFTLPGLNTVPEQIANNKKPYYDALEVADAAWASNTIDLSAMEELLSDRLANQLLSIFERADPKSARSEKINIENSTPKSSKHTIVQLIESYPAIATISAAILIAAVGWIFFS